MNKIKKSMIILSIIMTILIVVIIVLICVLKANQKELNNETQISEIERPDYKDMKSNSLNIVLLMVL